MVAPEAMAAEEPAVARVEAGRAEMLPGGGESGKTPVRRTQAAAKAVRQEGAGGATAGARGYWGRNSRQRWRSGRWQWAGRYGCGRDGRYGR